MLLSLLVLASAVLTHATIKESDFKGIGHINVIQSNDWRTASPETKVGCLNDHGKFIALDSDEECGVFSKQPVYPWALSTKIGNCTFDDDTQERNTDSRYGKLDYAWNCKTNHTPDFYDQLYTVDGFNYIFLCFGDMGCYYDAKRAPQDNEVLPFWQYHWGSQQNGITPGHIQLMLYWEKLGDLPKREGETEEPRGMGMRIVDGVQEAMMGARVREVGE